MTTDLRQLTNLVWSIADVLHGHFTASEYSSVLIIFAALRRLESARGDAEVTLAKLTVGPPVTAEELSDHLESFTSDVRIALEEFGFSRNVQRLENAGVLHQVVARFAEIDLRRETVSDFDVQFMFEDMLRRLVEQDSDSWGEHATPPDVEWLAVQMLLAPDLPNLENTGSPRTAMDPACGIGNLLHNLKEQLAGINPDVELQLSGQEINSASWAICRLRMLAEGRDPGGIELGNTLSNDRFTGQKFDYLIAAPSLGVDWKASAELVRQEHEELGMAGRFGAGLPRSGDSSLLFLQHMLSKMKPEGSRVVVLFSESAMSSGGAGSGESEIRRWVIDNDWLESITALPGGLLYNTALPVYLWTLTNRKPLNRRGKVMLINARGCTDQMRRPAGSKQQYLGNEQTNLIVRTYLDTFRAQADPDHPMHGQVRIIDNTELGHQQITLNVPLRLRFDLTEAGLGVLAKSRRVREIGHPEGILTALRSLVGSTWPDEQAALDAIERTVRAGNHTWPTDPAFRKTLTRAISVPDPEGTVQYREGAAIPDPDRRRSVRVPLNVDAGEYLGREILPNTPDAWIDQAEPKIGYAVSPMLFFQPTLGARFVPLDEVAERMQVARADLISGEDRQRELRMQDLDSVDSADELPEAAGTSTLMALCTGGDVVGMGSIWRVLPHGFGEAVTSLTVLRPRSAYARALSEWLNSCGENGIISSHHRYPPYDLPVPIELVTDHRVDEVLEGVHKSRRMVSEAMTSLRLNVFSTANRDLLRFREQARSVAVQASLAADTISSAVDPVWQAEWTYPFHVAALARRYRLSSQPAERKDTLLKLSEGLARTVGVLALSEFVDRDHLPEKQANLFGSGATFNTWLNLAERFIEQSAPPKMRELGELRDSIRLIEMLRKIKGVRNDSSHAHGVRAAHELEEEAGTLEPLVVSALVAANWLSTVQWDWVEHCAYLDESSYLLTGRRLRGSHTDWEPFERSSTYAMRPGRLYAGTSTTTETGQPVDLTPLAVVQICPQCHGYELFLIDKVNKGGEITLRSLEEHSVRVAQSPAVMEGGGGC